MVQRGRRNKSIQKDEAGELSIGGRMRLARMKRSVSLMTIAEKTKEIDPQERGYSIGHLSMVENGRFQPSFELAEMYEQILELKKGELTQYLPQERRGAKRSSESEGKKEAAEKAPKGELPLATSFYGRESELTILDEWIVTERKQVIAIVGQAGIGKTALAISIANRVKHHFQYLFWYSLQYGPLIEDFLKDCTQAISGGKGVERSGNLNSQITLLLNALEKSRCLIVLDNLETVLNDEGQYKRYRQLLQRLGENKHKSCILLTSRENPHELFTLEAKGLPVRSLPLTGLHQKDARKLIEEKKLSGTDKEYEQLIDFYARNPMALRLVAAIIYNEFGGNIAEFLGSGGLLFEGIRNLLEEQFSRLSPLEQATMYWMMIEREEVPLDDLQKDLIPSISLTDVRDILRSLQRRSLIEKKGTTLFYLHPVITDYVNRRFVEEIGKELERRTFNLFKSHALIKAQSKEYVRKNQVQCILKPVADHLKMALGKEGSEKQLKDMLRQMREEGRQMLDYMAGNILNLLIELQADLRRTDFSRLSVWQAYLQNVELPEVNFTDADLSTSVFSDVFGSVLSLALHEEVEFLAAGTANSVIRLWQLAGNEPVQTLQGHLNWVRSIDFSPDGRLLASGSDDCTIRLWKIPARQCIALLEEHTDRVRMVRFSPDGRFLASSSDDQTIRLWDTATWQCRVLLNGHTRRIRALAFSPDGRYLASGSDDCTILLWQVNDWKLIRKLEGHTRWIRTLAFSSDGRLLASGSDDCTVRLWNSENGHCLQTLEGHTKLVRTVAFAPQDDRLMSGSEDATIRSWRINDGACTNILHEHSNAVRALVFTRNGDLLISGGDDQTIRFWQPGNGMCLKTLQGYNTWIYSVTFSPDGRLLASGNQDTGVRIWEVASKSRPMTLRGHRGPVYSVAFSVDGRLLASGSQDSDVRIWEVSSGRSLVILQEHNNQVNSVTFSPDGMLLASGSEDNTICIWEIDGWQKLHTLTGHTNRVRTVAFSPNSRLLASGSEDTTVRIWEVASGRELATLPGHTDQVRSVAFSRDGRLLASGSEDNTIRVWQADGWQKLRTLEGHSKRVRSVIFTPDGRFLISGSEDTTLRIWEVGTWRCLKEVQAHRGLIYTIAINPDGTILASGSYDSTMKLWRIPEGVCQETLESERPYEKMNIKGASGLEDQQKNMLRVLGATEQ
jgi:WD40 repeat protein